MNEQKIWFDNGVFTIALGFKLALLKGLNLFVSVF